jgi:hypothetical protein
MSRDTPVLSIYPFMACRGTALFFTSTCNARLLHVCMAVSKTRRQISMKLAGGAYRKVVSRVQAWIQVIWDMMVCRLSNVPRHCFETSGDIHQTAHHIAEDLNPQKQRCDNLKSRECKYRRTPVSASNTFQDLPRLRETVDNTERYI